MGLSPITLRSSLELETRLKTPIQNLLDRTPSSAGSNIAVRDFKVLYAAAIHRPVGPCKTYNCHGLTFASRRAWVGSPEVHTILAEDDYVEILMGDKVLSGDIAVYIKDGDISHSGVVVYVKGETPWILSKWGEAHEVVHAAMDCPYNDCNIKFYRIFQ